MGLFTDIKNFFGLGKDDDVSKEVKKETQIVEQDTVDIDKKEQTKTFIPKTPIGAFNELKSLVTGEAPKTSLGRSWARFGIEIPGIVGGLVEQVQAPLKLLPGVGYLMSKTTDKFFVEKPVDITSNLRDKYGERFAEQAISYEKDATIFTNPRLLYNREYITDSIANAVPPLATMALTRGAGVRAGLSQKMSTFIGGYSLEGGMAMQERIENILNKGGEIDELDVRDYTYAYGVGAVNGLLETVGFGKLFNKNPNLKQSIKDTLEGGVKKTAAEFAKFISGTAKRTGAEMTTEYIQEFLPNIAAKSLFDETGQTWGEVIREANKEGLFAASQAFFVAAPMSSVTQYSEQKLERDAKLIHQEAIGDFDVALYSADPSDFIVDGRLDESLVDVRVQDIKTKLENAVGIEASNKFSENIIGKEFKSYKDFVNEAQDSLSKAIKGKDISNAEARIIAADMVGSETQVILSNVKEDVDYSQSISLAEEHFATPNKRIEDVDSKRYSNLEKTNISYTVASDIVDEVQTPTQTERPTKIPVEYSDELFEIRVEKEKELSPETILEKPKYIQKDIDYGADTEESKIVEAISAYIYDESDDVMPVKVNIENFTNKQEAKVSHGTKKLISRNEVQMMKLTIKNIENNIEDIEGELNTFKNSFIVRMDNIQNELDGSLASNEKWYNEFYRENSRSASKKELENLVYKKAKQDAENPVIRRTPEGEIAARYLDLENSYSVLKSLLNTYKKELQAKDNRVLRYINYDNIHTDLKQAIKQEEDRARDSLEIKRFDSNIRTIKELQNSDISNSFKTLSKSNKELLDTNPERFLDEMKDPYIMVRRSPKNGSIRTIMVQGSLVDNKIKSGYNTKFRVADKAERLGYRNSEEYMADMIRNRYTIIQTERERRAAFDRILNTSNYRELVRREVDIFDKMRIILASYKNPNTLLRAVRFKQLVMARDSIRKNFRYDMRRRINDMKAEQKKFYTDAVLLKKERKAILGSYEKTFPFIVKTKQIIEGDRARTIKIGPVQRLIQRYSTKLGKESNIFTMSDEKFDAILQREVDPIIEKHKRVTEYAVGINNILAQKEYKNIENLERALGIKSHKKLRNNITYTDLETMNIEDLEFMIRILNSYEQGAEFLPDTIIKKQLDWWKKNPDKFVADTPIFFTEDDAVRAVAETEGISIEGARAQLKRLRKGGYSIFNKTSNYTFLRFKDVYTHYLSTILVGMDNEIGQKYEKEQKEIQARLKAARKSRRIANDIVIDKSVTTDNVVFRFLDEENEEKKAQAYSEMTELEQDFVLWLRDIFFGEKGKMLAKYDGMLIRDNYINHEKKKLSEFLSESGLNIFSGIKKYLAQEDKMDANFNNIRESIRKGRGVSMYDQFQNAKQRTGDMEVTNDLGLILPSYALRYHKHMELSMALPHITPVIDIITHGIRGSKEKNIKDFWSQRVDSTKGIIPKAILEQGSKIDRFFRSFKTFTMLSFLAFRIPTQIMSIGGAVAGYVTATKLRAPVGVIRTLNFSGKELIGILGFKPNNEQQTNIKSILNQLKPVIGRNIIEDLSAIDRTIPDKIVSLGMGGYSIMQYFANLGIVMSSLTKEQINRGYLTSDEVVNITNEVTQVFYIGGVSESPLGRTTLFKYANFLQTWAIPQTYNQITTLSNSIRKTGDLIRKVKLNEHISVRELYRGWMQVLISGTITFVMVNVMLDMIEKGLLPEDQEDDDDEQRLIRRFMQDANSQIGGIPSFIFKYTKSIMAIVNTYADAEKSDINPFEYVDANNRTLLTEFDQLFGSIGDTGMPMIDRLNELLSNVVFNAARYGSDIYKYWKGEIGDERFKERGKELMKDVYNYFNLSITKKGFSFIGLEPGQITAKKEEREISEKYLGHYYGLNESEKKAYSIFIKQQDLTREEINAKVQALANSDDNFDNNVAKDLLKFHVNTNFTKQELRFIAEMNGGKTNADEWNTPSLKGTAINQYIRNIKTDKERVDFMNRLKNYYVGSGLLEGDAIKTAEFFWVNDVDFSDRELKFINHYSGQGDRANLIIEYIEEIGLNNEEVIRQLTYYKTAGFIDKNTEQFLMRWLKEKSILE